MDYNTAKAIFWLAATRTTGGTFVVDEQNKQTLRALVRYFSRQDDFERGTNSLSKGILLFGPPGTGKTLLLRIFRALVRESEYGFKMRTALEVANDYAANGSDALQNYRGVWCFDDLGIETTTAHYGDRRDVMTELIHHRYRLWQEHGTVTHFSTMLDAEQICNRYGEMNYSRLMQMCNWFLLGASEQATNRRFTSHVPPVIPPDLPRYFEPKQAQIQAEMQAEYEAYRQRQAELPPFKPGIGSLIKQHLDRLSA